MECNTEHIWKEFSGNIHSFIAHRVSNASAAEDILQEVFLKIHTNINSLKDCSKIRSWVYEIARNTIIDYYRKQKIKLDSFDELLPEEEDLFAATDEIKEENPVYKITSGLLGMIEALPEKYAQALILVEFQGLTQVELANKLGISVSGAKSRVQRARQMLKDSLMECCHFELDKYGIIINFYPNPYCCCCSKGRKH